MMYFLAHNLLPAVWSMSVTAAVVIAVVLLVRLLLRRAPKVFSYALWAVVLFRLLCPISFTTGFSLLGILAPLAAEPAATVSGADYVRPDTAQGTPQPDLPPVTGGSGAAEQLLPTVQRPVPITPAAPVEPPVPVLGMIWLSGVLAMLIYSAVSLLLLRRRLVGAAPLRDNIYLADHIRSPFVMGVLRPRIYLPSTLSRQEQTYIILHEQHHIRRLDHIMKLLAFAALCIHWFNPLVWLAFVLAGRDMEMSCDEAVVKRLGGGIRADYSMSLLRLATGRHMISGAPLAFGEGDTKSRVKNVLNWKKPRPWMILLAAAVCAAVIASCAVNPPGAEESPSNGQTGQYVSMEDFARQTMEAAETVTYYAAAGGEVTAAVTGTKLAWLEKQGELDGLAPDGTLEAWTFSYLVQVDAAPDDIMLVGGMHEEDGWYDLEGQGGHNLVTLRYEDGSYDILYDQVVNDNQDFYGYHNSYEEAIHDWYVTDQGMDLPLYVKDWTEQIIYPDGEYHGNYPVHRYDGDGWYLYIPVQAWTQWAEDAGHCLWTSDYNTGSALDVYRREGSARSEADGLAAQGWIEVEGAVPHVRHWEGGTEDYYYDAPDGGCYQVRISWQDQNLTDYPYIAVEPSVLRLMAESFTVDDRMSMSTSVDPGEAALLSALEGISEGDPLTLRLTRDGGEAGVYDDCWAGYNGIYYLNSLTGRSWQTAEAGSGPAEGSAVTLTGADWRLTAWENGEPVSFSGPDGEVWLIAEEMDYAETPYQALRGWFDEAEYADLGGYGEDSIVIPNTGQSWQEAAAAFSQDVQELHLQASEGSKYRYTFVQTSVESAEETTAAFRERGELGENGWCFYLTTVFVPENEQALNYSMAGNTGNYTGNDPAVPTGAYEHYRCCIITLDADGWHGAVLGTGW